jgi:hypothetical protein
MIYKGHVIVKILTACERAILIFFSSIIAVIRTGSTVYEIFGRVKYMSANMRGDMSAGMSCV